MDNFDLKLMRELQRNGRLSHTELAKKLGVVEGTIRKRIKSLIDNETMKIIAVPDLRQLDYNFITLMGLQVQMAELRNIADRLLQKPNICYLAFVTGRYDLIAFVATRSPKELSNFIEKEISAIAGILRTETFVNLDIIKGAAGNIDTSQLIGQYILSAPGKLKPR